MSHESTSPHTVRTSARTNLDEFIDHKTFPCVGAKSALNKGRIRSSQFGHLGDPAQCPALFDALRVYAAEFPNPGATPVSFIAMFNDTGMDEKEFEEALWEQLQMLHEYDERQGFAWNHDVSQDPAQNDFSFSVGGRAYFVVGMHPRASRLARRSPVPCLVFNFHEQFETLKASGKYQSMQKAIRARDVALQGSINPVLSRFGEASEARQYSGRYVEDAWKCPFHPQA
ncbi:FPC/CPF motif-containing protein YcgG [Variovorax boronicumulans]|uniref:guanitoxin biosynthesis heme-dependent pre-guanitoxin N-hydroxylase GntA n=1 Tax=Variovorax boronicumulans TaxID=436515 RepID=UPI002474902B|nr:guanitoxin biosynthesis heme-dependent pre-guanitoxin N-hydroxylase GntA [Variovorax boronicumulans]MDH6170045.1 FPC/CPF motif-containing protein YcgG [Variovorax boronicumulans]